MRTVSPSATSAAGTLRLALDDVGLVYEVDLPSFRSDVFELVQRGDVQKSSFAFITFEDDWTLAHDGTPLRTLVSGRAIDVAPVNTPAYLDTSSGLRSFAEARGLDLDAVRAAAEAGHLGDLLTSAPVDDEERAATDGEDETPQVDNHGLVIVRQRLMQLRLLQMVTRQEVLLLQ